MTDSSPVSSEVSLEDVARILEPLAMNAEGYSPYYESRRREALSLGAKIAALYAPIIAERDELRLAICGGEDVPGYNTSLSHEVILGVLRDNYQSARRDAELAWDGETASSWKSRALTAEKERDDEARQTAKWHGCFQAAEARAEALQAQVGGARKALEPWSRGWLPGASGKAAKSVRQALSTLSGAEK
jgi:hypothetical protein